MPFDRLVISIKSLIGVYCYSSFENNNNIGNMLTSPRSLGLETKVRKIIVDSIKKGATRGGLCITRYNKSSL